LTPPPPPYNVAFTDDAKSDVHSLDGSIKKRLRKILNEKIGVGPEQYGTPLRGNLAGFGKHEFASHRVIYRIYPDHKLVVVCAVGVRKGLHKTDVFRQLEHVAQTGRLAEQILAAMKSLEVR
jgi:mRNA interferase RelE/StbE